MELMQLEMFVTVYEQRSFKRAAEKVYRTQPAVSLAIAKLEKEIGSALLVRRRGRGDDFHLTRAGELVYEYASRMLGLRNELLAKLQPAKGRAAERLRLGVTEGRASHWLAQWIGGFRERRPHVSVEVWYEPREVLVRAVSERKIDVALFDGVPATAQGNMEMLRIPVIANSESEQMWFVQNRAGRSHTSLEFEQELLGSIPTRKEVWNGGKKPRVRPQPYRLRSESAATGTLARA
jgi:DNA-binding transcriptional LysR family regulator